MRCAGDRLARLYAAMQAHGLPMARLCDTAGFMVAGLSSVRPPTHVSRHVRPRAEPQGCRSLPSSRKAGRSLCGATADGQLAAYGADVQHRCGREPAEVMELIGLGVRPRQAAVYHRATMRTPRRANEGRNERQDTQFRAAGRELLPRGKGVACQLSESMR